MTDPKVIAGGVGVVVVGTALAVALLSGGPAPIDPLKVKISDPAARALFLKIPNPTAADVRRFEDSGP